MAKGIGCTTDKDGYVLRKSPTATRHSGYIPEHVLVAERVIGKRLPRKAVVHHHDGDPANNAPSNLVICENQTYHMLLHRRQRAFRATGDANKRLCVLCYRYDNLVNLTATSASRAYHKKCKADHELMRLNALDPARPRRARRKY